MLIAHSVPRIEKPWAEAAESSLLQELLACERYEPVASEDDLQTGRLMSLLGQPHAMHVSQTTRTRELGSGPGSCTSGLYDLGQVILPL